MSLEPGRVAGNYEILDYIRSSNDEVCYRVRNTLARRVESMRVLGAAVASDPERTERFLREMGVQARLAHPNILTFFGAVELDRQLVIMSELVEGVTLAERLLCGPMTWDEACGFTLQLLAALGHAHSLGIVHRDVTPARMIVTPDGVLKLTDFGLAKANTSPALTQVGSVVGNLKYISPEQIRGTALVDGRSDLYSAGIVLYECVTGRVPFDQKSQFELMAAHVSQPPAAPSAVNPRIPAGADAVILKALQKDPAARYQSAADFAAALANASAVARTSVPLPASILSAELPRSATECGAVLTAPLAYMEAAAGANGPVPVVTIASAVPAPADVSQTPAPATEPMAAPAIPPEVAAPPENAIP
ncbi:MAG TPA: protein kinase, partial [Bryobacteraceae bacterium]|nr:protein kinase [Bryobacteraceae bacterium]